LEYFLAKKNWVCFIESSGILIEKVSATTEARWREASALSRRRLEAGRCAEASCVGISMTA